ncbi:hypothetical protein MIR68_012167 [Amoeboaphelidium protococcarum]|nr:hypothetical protein MIR68_012167 [Amoeboaphelidium protococcarum]
MTSKKAKFQALKDFNYSFNQIAEYLKVPLSTIKSYWYRKREIEELGEKPVIIKRATDGNVGRTIKRLRDENPSWTIRDIERELPNHLQPGERAVKRTAISKYLARTGYQYIKLKKKQLISERNIAKRLQFCKNGVLEEDLWWMQILWSDETTFRKIPKDREVHMCFFGLGPLVALDDNMNADYYLQILEEFVIPEINAAKEVHGVDLTFMQDNAPCHKAMRVMDYLKQQGVQTLDWPAQSPDLNPIENLWAILKRKREKKYGVPMTRDELIDQVFAVWDEIDEELCKNLATSVYNRLTECIKAYGIQTKY